jgi:hypothetical protein
MTNPPPPDADPTAALPESDALEDPWHDQMVEVADNYGAPEVLALAAMVAAVGSLFGNGVMNGTAYIAPYLGDVAADDTSLVVLGIALGALLAMVPVVLGWRAASRVLDTDPAWISTVARTAVVLGLASGLLRLVIAVLTAAHSGPTGFNRL